MNDSSISTGSDRVRARNEARRLEILRAAARVFRRLGLSNTGMREIAEEAGLSPGNLYHYFSGKDQILLFCQERSLDRLLANVEAAQRSDASVDSQLRQALVGHVRVMLDEFEGATAHLEVEALPEALREPVVARRDAYERAIRALVARGVRTGVFSPSDPALVTRAMLGAVNWSARWYRRDGPRSAAAIAESLADYLVRGLQAGVHAVSPSKAIRPARRAAATGARK